MNSIISQILTFTMTKDTGATDTLSQADTTYSAQTGTHSHLGLLE